MTTTKKPKMNTTQKITLEEEHLAAVSYLPLLGILVYLGHRRDPYVAFHALQGSAISAYTVIAYFIPGFGQYICLAFAGLLATGFFHAARGEEFRIPVLASFLDFFVKK